MTSPVAESSCCKYVHMLPRVPLITLSFKGTPHDAAEQSCGKVLFTFEHNNQLCKQTWLLLEKKRHNWARNGSPA